MPVKELVSTQPIAPPLSKDIFHHTLVISLSPTTGIFKIPCVEVNNGDVLTWVPDDTDVTIRFERIGGAKVVDPESIDIRKGEKGSVRVVLVDPEGTISFYLKKYGQMEGQGNERKIKVPYSVYCVETNNYAEGDSDPKIIVKGP